MKKKINILIVLFSLIISFLVSYQYKKYKLVTYFGNNDRNYYQIESMYKFKKKNMMFDYAGSDMFKIIINTNNPKIAKENTAQFISELNLEMRKVCRKLENLDGGYLLNEFNDFCISNIVRATDQELHLNKKFYFIKFVFIFINLILILNLLKLIFLNLKFR